MIRYPDDKYRDMFVGDNEIYTFHQSERKIAVFSKTGVFKRDISHSDYSFPYDPGTPQGTSYITSNKDGELYVWTWGGSHPSIYKITDTSQEFLGTITAGVSAANRDSFWYVGKRAYIWDSIIRGVPGEYYTNFSVYGRSVSGNAVSLGSICEELFVRAGLSPDEYDVSEGTDLVDGYVIPNPMSTRASITSVTSAYNYELIETDFQIKLKKRDPTPIGAPISDVINFVEIERRQDVELSRMINITYANKRKNYDAGIQSAIRVDSNAESTKGYQFALSLTDSKAKQIAERFLFSEWNERVEFKFSLSSEYMGLQPADTVTISYKGDLFDVRITKIDYTSAGQLNCEGSLENQTVYESDAIGSDTGESIQEVIQYGITNLELLDIPMLDNSLDKEGVYIAASGYLSGWTGCNIDKSTDGETTYNSVGSIIDSTIIGLATSRLSDGTSTIIDSVNSVIISVNSPLYDISTEVLFNSGNYVLLGDEILQFMNSQDNGDGTYTLSNLLRGRRGTEWAMSTHLIGDRFVFLDTNMIFDTSASLNAYSYYKATTFGFFIEDSEAETITPEIRCLKPLAPARVYGIRDINNNLTIYWMRRSRDVTGYMKTLQLFEESESYEIDVITGSGRTLTSTSESVVYTSTDQTSDGLTLGEPIELNIYQISGIVGRGYASQEIV
ncbi:MAG: hypothetical protein DRI65_01830 [Chloroflexota bacterium]|nr:MAG: hypothetical protein DRI65_01830 [Chloroflexota bacterium]